MSLQYKVVGFSGSRNGLIVFQKKLLAEHLEKFKNDGATTFVHGDCVGCDAEAHRVARALGYRIEIRPPANLKMRAYCEGDVIHPPKTYAHRNWDIIEQCDVLLATPGASSKGTIMTMKFALKAGKPRYVFWPNGQVTT
jgi:hypothetical protein